jgi:hypothetical protein
VSISYGLKIEKDISANVALDGQGQCKVQNNKNIEKRETTVNDGKRRKTTDKVLKKMHMVE